MRYTKVLESLWNDYIFKSLMSGLLWLWLTLRDMFSTSLELILLLAFAVILDWFTGNLRAKRDKEYISSFGWRQTLVKVLEYAAFLFILAGIGNVFGDIDAPSWIQGVFSYVRNIEVFGYFYIIMTELKSISENVKGNENGNVSKLFTEIKDKLFNGQDIDA